MTEHQPEGGSPELKSQTPTREHDPERQARMEAEILRGIEDAEREQRAIDHRTARLIAEQLHGPDTPLHIFAQTGEVRLDSDDEDDRNQQGGVLREVVGLVPTFPDKQAWLEAMAQYALSREGNPGPVRGWQRLTADPEREALATDSPRIYVISLEDELAGRHYGCWIEADQDPDELQAGIDTLLELSPEPHALSWEVFDYQGFGGVDVFRLIDDGDPHVGLATISRVALGIAEHGQSFAAYVNFYGSDPETCSRFERSYLGRWHSTVDYARHFADELGWHTHIYALPEWMREFVTLDDTKLAAHLEAEIDVVEGSNGMVYLFSSD